MASGSRSWKRYSREYGSPGDILFSTVAGAPPHVHSPQKLDCFLDPEKANCPNKYLPISLSNSLIDPNIDLPTISVREVDAVLSSLNSSVSSTLAPDGVECKSEKNREKSNLTNSSFKCSDAIDLYSTSPTPYISDRTETDFNFSLKSSKCFPPINNSRTSTERRAFSLSVDKTSECNRLNNGMSSCRFSYMGERDANEENPLPIQNGSSFSKHAVNLIKPVCITSDGLQRDEMKVLTLRPSDLAQFLPSPSVQKKKNVTRDDSYREKNMYLTTQDNSTVELNLSSIHDISISKAQQLTRDRSPFVSLDLATHAPVGISDFSCASKYDRAAKCREANLNVRMANQAQFFPSRSIGSLMHSTITLQSKSTTSSHASTSPINLVTERDSQSEKTQKLVILHPSSGDDRFKYACPYPRCGRRYQAELALLRHLHKYHCEPVELPHRRRTTQNRRRRPASEERSQTHISDDPTADSVIKALYSADSLEDTVANTGMKTEINGVLQPTGSRVLSPLTTATTTSEPTVPLDIKKSLTLPSATKPRSVLTCSVVSKPGPDPNTYVAPQGSFRRCIVLQNTGCKGRPNLLRSTSISHNFPQLFDMTQTKELTSSELPKPGPNPPLRVARLRSISGSVSSSAESSTSSNMTTGTKTVRSWRSSELQTLSGALPGQMSVVTSHAVWPSYGGSTLESNGNRDHSTTENDGPNSVNTIEVTCPSCGFDLDESDVKRREWISGIRALTYSKTDSINCPMDGCTRICFGRADLSAHLTANHFPEVQNQLVRLIFACPLKDCQTVCPDEISFQAHFNQHLFGYLPGDLSGLFFPGSTIGSEVSNVVTSNDVSPSTLAQTMISSSTMVTVSESSPSKESVQQVSTCTTSTSVHLSFSSTERRNEVQVDMMDPAPEVVLPQSLSTELHTAHADACAGYGMLSTNSDLPCTSITAEPRALSDNSILVLRSPANALYMSNTEDPPLVVSPEQGVGTNTNKIECGGLEVPDAACSTSVTFDDSHVDLTDHRNLLSALDLIPDDILMELLKEDRPGIWGDTSGPNNFTTYSAPHEWDSPNRVVPHDLAYDQLPSYSHTMKHVDSSSPQLPTTSCGSLDEFGVTADASASPAPSSIDWVPSPVVHETWSLAVANERPSPELGASSLRYDRSLSASFDCPSLVLSDLTAALILPEVERRLRAKHEASQHNRTNNTTPIGVSGCPAPTLTCSSILEQTASEISGSTIPLSETETRSTRPVLNSGKRRRNASESSPTARFVEHHSATPRPGVPSKSGKHGSLKAEADRIKVGPNSSGHNLIPREHKPSHGSVTQTPIVPSTNTKSHSGLLSQVATGTSIFTGSRIEKAPSYRRINESTIELLSDSNFPCPMTCTLNRQRDFVDPSSHTSPKHFGAQPKRRRRKLPKVYTVSSDLTPVMVAPNKANLPRRHSLVHCNLIPSAQSPH